ncbi:hypothetical protein [Dyadobacter sp. LHD-138]|uniref:hypothetical protein n=1 Tax=Dyadobacter sp. LHD-138 TaxID=3071413 RepID=UPI0027DF05C8|nr:hypothetical protein [Dyadobacter sp. LHD-138]MDQ6482159.1 hypothetical protein [Dyadobacter sp. LHD-138]
MNTYEIPSFNSIFELMAVYNFGYVGLDQITVHTNKIFDSFRKALITEEELASYELVLARSIPKNGNQNSATEFAKISTAYNVATRETAKLKAYGTVEFGKKFISLYSYFGIYCFLVLFVGGIMQTQETAADKLYFFLDVYNAFLVIPYILLYLRENIKTPPTAFALIFLFHFVVTAVYIATHDPSYGIFNILKFQESWNKVLELQLIQLVFWSLLLFVIVFIAFVEAYRLIHIHYKEQAREVINASILILLKVMSCLIIIFMYSKWVEVIIGMNDIGRTHTSVATIVICFSPIFIIIGRIFLGVIRSSHLVLKHKPLLDQYWRETMENQFIPPLTSPLFESAEKRLN